jgi:hypothetical protein
MKKLCAHCSIELEPNEVHLDHTPPKNLFPKGTEGLIKVPSCRKCNNGASMDDEYFRLLAFNMATELNPAAKQANTANVRAIMRPESQRFRNALFSRMEPVILTTEMGLYAGETFKLKMDVKRLIRVIERTGKGLFYHYKEHPLSKDYAIKCYCLNMMNEAQRKPFETLILPPLLTTPVHEIGNGTFKYRFGFSKDDPCGGAFLLNFYEWVDFLAVVYPVSLESQLRKELKETGTIKV